MQTLAPWVCQSVVPVASAVTQTLHVATTVSALVSQWFHEVLGVTAA